MSLLPLVLLGCEKKTTTVVANTRTDVSVDLRLMETTDLHGNMMPYNYFSNTSGQNYGFARTAQVIKTARAEVTNSMLFDNGDLIQGSPMADYMASKGVEYLQNNRHSVYKAMNLMDYDVANIGNHEFNYGLDYLNSAINGADFPYIVANVFKYPEGQFTRDAFPMQTCEARIDEAFLDQATPYFNPYKIIRKDVVGSDGKVYSLNVGVIGFTPPNVMNWDKSHLECKVVVSDIKKTAQHFVPKMKAEGADIIVAIPHAGLQGGNVGTPFIDNATWQLAQVEGIDAVMFGHDHNNFPTEKNTYDNMNGVDPKNGKIHGKPAVMPGYWGNNVGVIDLAIESKDAGKTWNVNYSNSTAKLRALHTDVNDMDQNVLEVLAEDHEGTKAYMSTPILGINQKINSFFSAVKSDISVQIVNEAQFKWGKDITSNGTLNMDPNAILLSVSAPFKGGRGGNEDYTNITGDALTNASVADLYVFDNNTPAVLKLKVADIKEWLETIASQQYQTVTQNDDPLLHQMFRSYNFDVFYGGWDNSGNKIELSYEIDVSQPPRYLVDEQGELIKGEDNKPQKNPNGDYRRISDLTYNGAVLDDSQIAYVVTNNYRASNKWIPGVDNSELVHSDSAYSNRQLVDQYLKHLKKIANDNGATNPEKPLVHFDNANNFKLKGPSGVTATFLSSPSAKAFSEETAQCHITWTSETGPVGDNTGFQKYKFSFDQSACN
ncbi:bifunctional 2',3'-cyclic-nucleotide 2'-phosphodiesterase/3'-nucleotidase [Vibrio sp. SCSIO 43140]|nr:bifunctional 2',3'-cyclic-nucleotide 2'-phosphodiesterase/3'-nucleotidase [Vibrio sp. SCSIO 43140]